MKAFKKIWPVGKLDIVYDQIVHQLTSAKLPTGCLDLLTFIVSEMFAKVKEHAFAKKNRD